MNKILQKALCGYEYRVVEERTGNDLVEIHRFDHGEIEDFFSKLPKEKPIKITNSEKDACVHIVFSSVRFELNGDRDYIFKKANDYFCS